MHKQRTQNTEDPDMASISNLTPAEARVFNEALRGLSVKELAEQLFLTEATIKSHLAHIYSKLGVRGRLDLLARFAASENGNDGSPSTARIRRNGRSGYEPGPPKTPWLAYGAVPGAILAGLLLFVLTVWLVETLSVQSTSRVRVEQLINADAVAALELVGGTLEVTTSDGRHLQVAGVTADEIRPLATEHEIPFAIRAPGSDSLAGWQITLNLLPYAALLIAVWLGAVALFRAVAARRSATA